MGLLSKINEYRSTTRRGESFALNQLDQKLRPYLNFNGGFFIEAGANDGIAQSNTLFFERYQKWSGILIEPIPELASACRANRPNCIVESFALVPFGFKESYVESCEIQNITTYELNVPARTLSSILDQHSVQEIDLLSLDVEGFELSVLQGLDLDKYKPYFMLIEARYREEIDGYLKPLYEPIEELSYHDVLYKRNSH